jgi:hypothetical protein
MKSWRSRDRPLASDSSQKFENRISRGLNTRSFVATSAEVLLGFAAVLSLGLTAIQDAGAGPQKVESRLPRLRSYLISQVALWLTIMAPRPPTAS